MPTWNVQVRVWLKPSVFDPQGNAVEHALTSLGHEGFDMELRVQAESEEQAHVKVREVCDTVLCNPVMETYSYTMTQAQTGAAL